MNYISVITNIKQIERILMFEILIYYDESNLIFQYGSRSD